MQSSEGPIALCADEAVSLRYFCSSCWAELSGMDAGLAICPICGEYPMVFLE